MRLSLSLLIVFQLIAVPAGADVGEKKPFKVSQHLWSTMAKVDAEEFEASLRTKLEEVAKKGVEQVTTTVAPADLKKIGTLKTLKPLFKEVSRGKWEYHSDGNVISFSVIDIYEGRLLINGIPLDFTNKTFDQLESGAQKLLSKKTTLLRKLIDESFSIKNAQACELVCASVVVVFVVAMLGTAVYQMFIKPERMVRRLNEMKKKLDSDAQMCEESRTDSSQYSKTFALAESISERTSLNSFGSANDAMEYAIKRRHEMIRNEDCFQIMNEVGKKLKVDIPIPTDRQILRRELTGAGLQNEAVDLGSAAIKLCDSYNRLGSCMNMFLQAHVNDEGFGSIKDVEPNHSRYRRFLQQAGRQ